MRSFFALICASLFVSCSGAAAARRDHAEPQATPSDAPLEFLLTSAATDFHAHRPPDPARFRNVRIGYVVNPDGTRQFMLCGAFMPSEGDRPQWTPFATIKTSGYEQYLGSSGHCERPSVVWISGDLSTALKTRLDSAQ
jgi:hypothetical protein